MREIAAPLLSERTTLRLGGPAIAELVIENMEDLTRVDERVQALGGRPFCIGHGSNLLALSDVEPLVLIRLDLGRKIEILSEADGKVLVYAGADVPLPRLLRFCLRHGFGGLEGLVGIPGLVGGAIAMNAGSFGTETGDCLHAVTVASGGNLRHLKLEDLSIKYRKIDFTDKYGEAIVCGATFALTRVPKHVIFTAMHLNFFEKKSKQPIESWSAGCAFKNPPGYSAGKLLENCGFRGCKFGGMAFSARHANFLINEGKGTPESALELLKTAQNKVLERFGIKLEPEVRIIPWPLS